VAGLEYTSFWGAGEAAITEFLIHAHVVRGIDLVNTGLLPLALDLLLEATRLRSRGTLLFLLYMLMILVNLVELTHFLLVVRISMVVTI
jgi:hypothetical protein